MYEVLDLLLQHVPEDFLHPRELFEADNQNPQQLLPPPVDVNEDEDDDDENEEDMFQRPDLFQHGDERPP